MFNCHYYRTRFYAFVLYSSSLRMSVLPPPNCCLWIVPGTLDPNED